MIIDSHVHLPVFEDASLSMQKIRLHADMKNNNVGKCIVISDSELTSVIGTMDECVDLFYDDENVYVVGGISPFFDFEIQLEKLERYLIEKKAVGIKLFPGHESFYLTDERLGPVYILAKKYDVPVLFHSGWDNSEYSAADIVAQTAEKYSGTKIVCCHCLYPNINDCLALTKYENLYFDLSSVADDRNTFLQIKDDITALITAAPDRVIFGSDYACCNQKEHIDAIMGLELTEEISNRVFCENARLLYHI
ncbi:MAG: amidohydrolase family protein [Clostridia bacterium]|nr:amidohydrolase family protein [Clostridia bacterium]